MRMDRQGNEMVLESLCFCTSSQHNTVLARAYPRVHATGAWNMNRHFEQALDIHNRQPSPSAAMDEVLVHWGDAEAR